MDHIANCFSAIFNGLRAALRYTDIMQSKKLIPILSLLYKDGFVTGFEKRLSKAELPYLRIFLGARTNVITARFRRVSKSSLRIYKRFINILKDSRNGDYFIVSTTAGIKNIDQLFTLRIGGEIMGRRVVTI